MSKRRPRRTFAITAEIPEDWGVNMVKAALEGGAKQALQYGCQGDNLFVCIRQVKKPPRVTRDKK